MNSNAEYCIELYSDYFPRTRHLVATAFAHEAAKRSHSSIPLKADPFLSKEISVPAENLSLLRFFLSQLQNRGLKVDLLNGEGMITTLDFTSETEHFHPRFCVVSFTKEGLQYELKRIKKKQELDNFLYQFGESNSKLKDSSTNENNQFELYSTQSTTSYLLHRALESIEIRDDTSFSIKKGKKLKSKELTIKANESLLEQLQAFGVVKQIFPLHVNSLKAEIWREGAFFSLFRYPIEAIKDYFGSKVALYFAWVEFYIQWLCLPAFVALMVSYFTG
jgi:hypothetical protein